MDAEAEFSDVEFDDLLHAFAEVDDLLVGTDWMHADPDTTSPAFPFVFGTGGSMAPGVTAQHADPILQAQPPTGGPVPPPAVSYEEHVLQLLQPHPQQQQVHSNQQQQQHPHAPPYQQQLQQLHQQPLPYLVELPSSSQGHSHSHTHANSYIHQPPSSLQRPSLDASTGTHGASGQFAGSTGSAAVYGHGNGGGGQRGSADADRDAVCSSWSRAASAAAPEPGPAPAEAGAPPAGAWPPGLVVTTGHAGTLTWSTAPGPGSGQGSGLAAGAGLPGAAQLGQGLAVGQARPLGSGIGAGAGAGMVAPTAAEVLWPGAAAQPQLPGAAGAGAYLGTAGSGAGAMSSGGASSGAPSYSGGPAGPPLAALQPSAAQRPAGAAAAAAPSLLLQELVAEAGLGEWAASALSWPPPGPGHSAEELLAGMDLRFGRMVFDLSVSLAAVEAAGPAQGGAGAGAAYLQGVPIGLQPHPVGAPSSGGGAGGFAGAMDASTADRGGGAACAGAELAAAAGYGATGSSPLALLRTQMSLFRQVMRYLGLMNDDIARFVDTTLSGETLPPQPGHHERVVAALGLSQAQLADAAALHACTQEWLGRIYTERRSVSAALSQLLTVNRYGGAYAETVSQYGTDAAIIHKMQANVKREKILVVLAAEVFCCHILTDIQWARAIVFSRPYVYDTRELIRVAAQLHAATARGLPLALT
ncbi:hypothetical protein TSOC_003576 [Tetrabaena socialis]|uniref:Uncharacterized protein n=1 Tax=Tetrabaena socialis TaxID=47790 RepID=A0A2J8AB64_9CHLO|nr:hypothetical protein TSOC_003576 [Tetrabaena socialis]|eukprot:PNH09765.1 hypothetical protein TSOC_003576 [Tetrabaena socialis]